MTRFTFCAYIASVFDAATAPAEALHPDPADRAVPPRVGKLLCLLHTFSAYGRSLADTLRQHAADPRVLPCFTHIALTFRSVDLTLILARITRGLLRAAALEERLRQRAARFQDLDPDFIRTRKPCKPGTRKKPSARLHDPARDPSPDTPPTFEQIAAEDRRHPIGAILADICLDLGIVPAQMDRATQQELRHAVIDYRGNLGTLYLSRPRNLDDLTALLSDLPLPVDKDGQPIITYPEWPAPSPQPPVLASTGPT